MPQKQLTITGETTKDGGYGIFNRNQLKDFCENNPNKKLIITYRIEEKKSKEAMIAYYYAKVVPEWHQYLFKTGYVLSEKKVDKMLLNISPVTKSGKQINDLTRDEVVQFLDHVKISSMEDAYLFVEDPRCL